MKLEEFNYSLPDDLIAQHPLKDRGAARLLVLERTTGSMEHLRFHEIVRFFKPGDLLIINNTKVFRARLLGRKETGGQVEMLLLKEGEKANKWLAMIAPARRIRTGTKIFFDKDRYATVRQKTGSRCTIVFNVPVDTIIKEHGSVPLPHYIKRTADESDTHFYQTVFAKKRGSIAAPTAGLHFTTEILTTLRKKDITIGEITLHIGPGTFKPIRAEQIEDHAMEPEYYEIPHDVAQVLEKSDSITAVGTSVCRALETYAVTEHRSGSAGIFIYPGHTFKLVNRLITNFHLPCSTPLLLASAFAGKDVLMSAYRAAIERKYRFLSYGDAMLIL
ncbi:MAG: tRNA preQ1(34) S-adenosylmethionine ribosyltransferase-isomerase QueA [candidate division WOR-3 bacterium]|nr:MAG: tRNA preQ1(34) S-adenosylmethionine ribosyltransferase-isomerase QueA [candidate division WOR-3 bacterium]